MGKILVDAAYAAANDRTREWARKQVEVRFKAVYGEDGIRILDNMRSRMDANIESDSASC